jgi:hypothetical protein
MDSLSVGRIMRRTDKCKKSANAYRKCNNGEMRRRGNSKRTEEEKKQCTVQSRNST